MLKRKKIKDIDEQKTKESHSYNAFYAIACKKQITTKATFQNQRICVINIFKSPAATLQ